MEEMLKGISRIKESMVHNQPVDLLTIVYDMNPIGFFSERNLMTIENLMKEDAGGLYSNLNYVIMLTTNLKTTTHSGYGTLYDALKNYVGTYLDAVEEVCPETISGMVVPDDYTIADTDIPVTLFGLLLSKKIKL
jgi:hypothetical protein